jgi:alpha-galactosidase
MNVRRLLVAGCLLAMLMPVKAQKLEHLADTPQMGWSTWNKFQGNISEDVIKGIADAMVT